MTNTYDKEMMAPVPNYYYITSLNKEWFSTSTTFDRDCQCEIDNSTELKTSKGQDIWKVSEGKCGYNDFCLRFKPKETKNFIVKFTDPVYGEVKKLIFYGFNRKWLNPESNRNMETGLVINIDTKSVIGEKRF